MVLVKVTGRRTADEDPALGPLITNARRYVQQYRSAPDNQLWVAFDGSAIERWLTQNGQPLWGHERPTTFVWMTVPSSGQSGTVVTAEDTSELKSAVDAAAAARGLPLQWPSASDLQRNHLDYSSLSSASAASLVDLAHRLGAEGVLIGRATNSSQAAGIRWSFLFQDRSGEFSGAAADGINRAADSYAGLFAVSGSSAPVDIEVAGINDLREYARLEAYLESLAYCQPRGGGGVQRRHRAVPARDARWCRGFAARARPERTVAADRRGRRRGPALPIAPVMRRGPLAAPNSERRQFT